MRMKLQYVKSASSTIYIKGLEGYDNDLFVTQILSRGDKQKRQSNVKADMTEWKVNEVEWYNLCKDIIENHIVFLSGEIDVEWQIVSVWGATYRKSDYTLYHSHMPSTFSFCYYPKVGSDPAPLVFSDLDYEIVPEESQLVLFPAYLNHGVPSHTNDEERVVIAGNIIAKYP
tara:strand:- start:224 stop:739 length:516 start_codon:yes stop_codon:yes gene_type:complete